MTKNNKFAFSPSEKKEKSSKNKNFLLQMDSKNLNEDEIMKMPLEKCIEKGSKGGLTGL